MRLSIPSVQAASEEEVVATVRAARAGKRKLRVVGSGGSKSGITAIPDTALHLVMHDAPIRVSDKLVTVPSSMTGGELQTLLAAHDLALPTVGEWKHATLGGALATGTHGGSARHGIWATSVRKLRMVTGEGEIVELTPSDLDFAFAGVSLGALGVITQITLQCEARFWLELTTDVVSFDEYARDPVAHESRSEFHASVWVPTARRVIRFSAKRIPQPAAAVTREERFGRRTKLATFLSQRLNVHSALSAGFIARTAVDDSAAILSPLLTTPQVARRRTTLNTLRGREAAELAVETSRASQALLQLDALFCHRRFSLNHAIGLRLSAADDFALSPCFKRDTLWIDIFYDRDPRVVEGLHTIAREQSMRCHWGKTLAVPAEALRDQYPLWQAFRTVRKRMDPDEVFANAFTDRLGLTGNA